MMENESGIDLNEIWSFNLQQQWQQILERISDRSYNPFIPLPFQLPIGSNNPWQQQQNNIQSTATTTTNSIWSFNNQDYELFQSQENLLNDNNFEMYQNLENLYPIVTDDSIYHQHNDNIQEQYHWNPIEIEQNIFTNIYFYLNYPTIIFPVNLFEYQYFATNLYQNSMDYYFIDREFNWIEQWWNVSVYRNFFDQSVDHNDDRFMFQSATFINDNNLIQAVYYENPQQQQQQQSSIDQQQTNRYNHQQQPDDF